MTINYFAMQVQLGWITLEQVPKRYRDKVRELVELADIGSKETGNEVGQMQFNMFEFLRNMIATEDGLIIFLLGLIVAMEIIDFFSGTFAAVINPGIEYKSKIGINGLLRKIQGIVLLTVLIPMSVLLPEQTGVAFLYTIYIGYLILTFKSLVENYGKAKGDTTIFENVATTLEKLIGRKE